MNDAKFLSNEVMLAEGKLEVEFALVLARTIEDLHDNPDQLRQIVYDLARSKLLEQSTHADAHTVKHAQKALETAIAGVEQFVQTTPSIRTDLPPARDPASDLKLVANQAPQAVSQPLTIAPVQTYAPRRRASPSSGVLKRTSAVLLTAVLCVVVYSQRSWIRDRLFGKPTVEQVYVPEPTETVTRSAASTPASGPTPDPNRNLPTRFGIYAVADGQLFDLQPLPGAAPDIRIAISFAITTPSRTTLTEPHPKFIVYRRDTPDNAVDRADVRVVAKIKKSFAVPKDNQVKEADQNWVIRNISIPYRASPLKERAGMYELTIDDLAGPGLPPGRYALIINDRAYDFTIAGDGFDDQHCLERVVATNGIFYTPCKSQ